MIAILGVDYWFGHHVHDGKLIHDLFLPIQVIGHLALVNNMTRRMLTDELFHQVTMALDLMDVNLSSGLLKALFAPVKEKDHEKSMDDLQEMCC